MKKIILASASPRRQEILKNLGIDFETLVSDADEGKIDKNSVPVSIYVQELALLKATAVAEKVKNAIIISADTVVCLGGEILGKPKDEENAKEMLRFLSGKCHSVFTGICVMDARTLKSVCSREESKVYFKELSEERIADYVKTGEPLDKAGAYAVQGLGGMLVEKTEGDFLNIIGLPANRLCDILEKEFQFDIFKEQNNEI